MAVQLHEHLSWLLAANQRKIARRREVGASPKEIEEIERAFGGAVLLAVGAYEGQRDLRGCTVSGEPIVRRRETRLTAMADVAAAGMRNFRTLAELLVGGEKGIPLYRIDAFFEARDEIAASLGSTFLKLASRES